MPYLVREVLAVDSQGFTYKFTPDGKENPTPAGWTTSWKKEQHPTRGTRSKHSTSGSKYQAWPVHVLNVHRLLVQRAPVALRRQILLNSIAGRVLDPTCASGSSADGRIITE